MRPTPTQRMLVLPLILVVLLVAACGGHAKPSYPSAARPPLPAGITAPASSCPAQSGQHVMGQCLPKPVGKFSGTAPLKLSPTQSNVCVDLSNNDPIYSRQAWLAIARRVSCAIFKVNEGTGYIDGTAAAMANVARSVGLTVSGYDFQHVCGDSAIQEADVFAYHLKADGLTGPHTLPGWADVEYGNGSCGARSWENTWHARVAQDLGREPGTYTGAWFWNPTFGNGYWPGGYSWISGYGISYPYMPAGHSELDLFQNADNGYNGYNTTDLSYWYGGQKSYCGAITDGCGPPPPPPDPYHYLLYPPGPFQSPYGQLNERLTAERYDGARKHPVRYRTYLVRLRAEEAFLAHRVYDVAAHLHGTPRHPGWGYDSLHLGFRYQLDLARSRGDRIAR